MKFYQKMFLQRIKECKLYGWSQSQMSTLLYAVLDWIEKGVNYKKSKRLDDGYIDGCNSCNYPVTYNQLFFI